MYKKLFSHPSALEQAILFTTLLSNNCSKAWCEDSKKIIDFICEAYDIKPLAKDFTYAIQEEISNLALAREYNGFKAYKSYNDEYSDVEKLYDLKGKLIDKLRSIKESPANPSPFNALAYSSINSYIPYDRFKELLEIANYGNPIVTCMVGIMYACGIGTERNLDLALLRFKQCSFWGYREALSYAMLILKLKEDKDSLIFKELKELSDLYLYNGITIIPEEAKANYSDSAKTCFALISSIYQDIVLSLNRNNIDFSFLEVMFLPALSYQAKMSYINSYEEKKWKDATNSCKKPAPGRDSIGFKLY